MPPLPETLLSNLCVFNIRTAPDLIFVPPAELLRKLPVVSITFLELTNRIAHVRNAFVGPAFAADQLIGGLRGFRQPAAGCPRSMSLLATVLVAH